jgi:hypothetical protein
MLGFGGSLLAVHLIAPSGLGMGDVKLGALIGFVLGSLDLQYVVLSATACILAGSAGAAVMILVRDLGAGVRCPSPRLWWRERSWPRLQVLFFDDPEARCEKRFHPM